PVCAAAPAEAAAAGRASVAPGAARPSVPAAEASAEPAARPAASPGSPAAGRPPGADTPAVRASDRTSAGSPDTGRRPEPGGDRRTARTAARTCPARPAELPPAGPSASWTPRAG